MSLMFWLRQQYFPLTKHRGSGLFLFLPSFLQVLTIRIILFKNYFCKPFGLLASQISKIDSKKEKGVKIEDKGETDDPLSCLF